MTNKYEACMIFSVAEGEEKTNELKAKFAELIAANATVANVDDWGKRRLAYPIDYITEGYYVLVTFKSEPSFPIELNRVFGITEGVLRYMTTVKVEKAAKAEPAVAEAEATVEATEEA